MACFFKVYCNLLSTVDHTLISLSSPHEANKSPSHEKLNPRILALCALINVVYFPEHSYPISQNFNDSSFEAETIILPAGENFISWIWLYVMGGVLCGRLVLVVGIFLRDSIGRWCYPCQLMPHICRKDTNLKRLLIIYDLLSCGLMWVLLLPF